MGIVTREIWSILLPALNIIDLTRKMSHFLSHTLVVSEMTRKKGQSFPPAFSIAGFTSELGSELPFPTLLVVSVTSWSP
jgi:hypothetical protein